MLGAVVMYNNKNSTLDCAIRNISETGARLVDVMGLHSEYRVANVFPYAPHLAFWQVAYCGMGTGTLTLNTGGGRIECPLSASVPLSVSAISAQFAIVLSFSRLPKVRPAYSAGSEHLLHNYIPIVITCISQRNAID